jgi:hypothetical protein
VGPELILYRGIEITSKISIGGILTKMPPLDPYKGLIRVYPHIYLYIWGSQLKGPFRGGPAGANGDCRYWSAPVQLGRLLKISYSAIKGPDLQSGYQGQGTTFEGNPNKICIFYRLFGLFRGYL